MIRELVLAIGPVALAWAAVVYRLPVLWRPAETAGLRAHWFAHITLAVALTFLFAPVYLAFDALVGVANLARLLAHTSVLVSAWCVQVYFAYLALPRDRARATSVRGGVLLLWALLLLGLFFHLANVDEDAFDFTGHFASAPFVLEYRLIFLAYLGWSMVILITLARRYAPLARTRPALFLGLHLLALAGWVALAYVVHEGAWAVSRRLNLPYPVPQPELVKEVLVAVSIGLLLVGATLPAWGPRAGVPALYRWGRATWRVAACTRSGVISVRPCPTWPWCRRRPRSAMPWRCAGSNCGSRDELSRFGMAVLRSGPVCLMASRKQPDASAASLVSPLTRSSLRWKPRVSRRRSRRADSAGARPPRT